MQEFRVGMSNDRIKGVWSFVRNCRYAPKFAHARISYILFLNLKELIDSSPTNNS